MESRKSVGRPVHLLVPPEDEVAANLPSPCMATLVQEHLGGEQVGDMMSRVLGELTYHMVSARDAPRNWRSKMTA